MIRCPVCGYTLPAPRMSMGEPSPITNLDDHVLAVHPDHPLPPRATIEVPAGATLILDGYVIGTTTEPAFVETLGSAP